MSMVQAEFPWQFESMTDNNLVTMLAQWTTFKLSASEIRSSLFRSKQRALKSGAKDSTRVSSEILPGWGCWIAIVRPSESVEKIES